MQRLAIRQQAPKVIRTTSKLSRPTRRFTASANMSLFPRSFQQEFSPIFRLMDDYAALARHGFPGQSTSAALRSFQPKFDVSETEAGYNLHGELPGIDQKDVSIEWTDGNTLTVSGRAEHRYESSAEHASDASETKSHQPSVEDESPADKPTESAESTEVAKAEHLKDVQTATNAPKYWVSERSVGEFARSFSFPTRVDQENVKASLKNGVLEISVPKAAKPVNRKVSIE